MKKIFSFLAAATMLLAASCSTSDDLDDEDGDVWSNQPTNEIWYTCNKQQIIYETPSGFGANIISGKEENGKRIMIFDSDVISIGNNAFCGWYTMTRISIPSNVTTIGNSAFSQCFSLKMVTIPNSVTSIKEYAFSYCRSLTSITIPNSITSIGYQAFSFCTSLTSVYCKAMAAPKLGHYIFDWCPLVKIYVPIESVDAYKSADGWKEYADMIEGYNFDE